MFDGDECRACAGYRLMNNLVSGHHMYVDDLVTAEQWRSHGYGRLLNEYLVELARREGCPVVQLDSATYRREAHRFYFRERYAIWSFHFVRPLRGIRRMNDLTPLERVRAYYRDLNTGDTEKVARHFHPDANHFYTRLGPHRGARVDRRD